MAGPLSGLRVIEMGGIGPSQLTAMLLADLGAEVVRLDRPGGMNPPALRRTRKVMALDVKSPEGIAKLRELARTADALIDPFRPGVMERLGLGPDALLSNNPRLVFGRMTGWGQTGTYAHTAGHDINYISLPGALHAIGGADRPLPPLALVGDMGGGGMVLAFGMCAALLHAQRTGQGQVIDCAMTEGVALLMTGHYEMLARGEWVDERQANLLDGACFFYGAYETLDGKFVSIGPIEPQFYALLIDGLDLAGDPDFTEAARWDRTQWPARRARLEAIFKTRTRAQWCELFEGTDVCFAPVMSVGEAPHHPHAVSRRSFVEVDGIPQPAPAPRFSATPLDDPSPAVDVGLDFDWTPRA